MDFETWMRFVERELLGLCGMGHMELPDYCYRDMFDDGETPQAAAIMALDNADFPFSDKQREQYAEWL